MTMLDDLRASRAPALAFVSMGMVWAALAAQVPVIKAQIGASDAVFGMTFLIANIAAMTAVWLAPVIDRRFGALSVAVSAALMGVAFVVPAMSPGLLVFTVAFFVSAGASGVTDVLMNARVADIEAARKRPLMNLNHAVFSFAYGLTAIATGWAREDGLSPATVFSAVAIIILAMAPFMRQDRPEGPDTDAADPAPRLSPLVWLGGIVVMVAFLSETAVEGWSALHIERTLRGGAAEGAMGPAILGLTMAFGRVFGQVLVARVSDTTMIAGACLVSATGLAVAAVAPTVMVAFAGFGLMGLGTSVIAPLALALVGRIVPPGARVAAIGRASVIGYIAFFLGPSMMGLTAEFYGLRAAFMLVAGLLVIVALALMPFMRQVIARSQ